METLIIYAMLCCTLVISTYDGSCLSLGLLDSGIQNTQLRCTDCGTAADMSVGGLWCVFHSVYLHCCL